MFRLINYSEARVTRRRKRKEGRKEEYIGVGREEMGLQRIFSESRKEYYIRAEAERRVPAPRLGKRASTGRYSITVTFSSRLLPQEVRAASSRSIKRTGCAVCNHVRRARSNLDRLKAYCTIVKFCANRWRKNRCASRCAAQWKLHTYLQNVLSRWIDSTKFPEGRGVSSEKLIFYHSLSLSLSLSSSFQKNIWTVLNIFQAEVSRKKSFTSRKILRDRQSSTGKKKKVLQDVSISVP